VGESGSLSDIAKNIANRHYSIFHAYGAVAGLSRFVPRDNDRYVGLTGSIDFRSGPIVRTVAGAAKGRPGNRYGLRPKPPTDYRAASILMTPMPFSMAMRVP
jgi:hypothetical protein